MLIKTLLNKVEKYESFVYEGVRFEVVEGREALVVEMRARANAELKCPECGQRFGIYDTQQARLYEYVPLWGIKVFFRYSPRRADCPVHGAKVEQVPWAQGKEHQTTSYKIFLAGWAKRLSWLETARIFAASWNTVYRAVKYVVDYGLAHRTLDNVETIGVDELHSFHGQNYLTLVYQLDEGIKRLLWCAPQRKVETLSKFFLELGDGLSRKIKFACSDMWSPYLKVIKEKAPQAVNILDRFHIMKKFNEAIDKIRRSETKKLEADGQPNVLAKSRWLLLKKPANLSQKQTATLSEILKINLASVKAYLLREDFQRFWDYKNANTAEKFLDEWITRTLKTKLNPLKQVARMLRKHKPLILNWFKANGKLSSGAVEGMNLKANLTVRKTFGFRTTDCLQTALYHTLGNLPEPKLTHSFL